MTIAQGAVAMGFVLTQDRARAKGFYADVLGFRLMAEDDYGAEFSMGGLSVRLTDIADHKAGPHPVLGFAVPDITAAAQDLAAKGVTCAIYEGFGQDALGIWTSPDGKTRLAWFSDPDGNVLMLSQKS